MRLSSAQVQEFERVGFLLIPDVFSPRDVARVKAELPALMQTDGPNRIMENDRRLVRSVYGCHRDNDVCDQLTRHPRLLLPAMTLLDGSVYVYQFKINTKSAFGGDQWEWHQDYIFWRNEDGMRRDRVLNVAVFLDDVTEFNGPMLLLPGSHHEGVIEGGAARHCDSHAPEGSGTSPAGRPWLSHLTTGLKYALDLETMKALASRWGIQAPKAPAGAVLIFHPNIVHGSSPNMSPFDRAVAIVTFNRADNAPPPREHPRPEFLASRDVRPLVPVADDVWSGCQEHDDVGRLVARSSFHHRHEENTHEV